MQENDTLHTNSIRDAVKVMVSYTRLYGILSAAFFILWAATLISKLILASSSSAPQSIGDIHAWVPLAVSVFMGIEADIAYRETAKFMEKHKTQDTAHD